MATISNAAIFSSLKLSNRAPRSRLCSQSSNLFKSMSSNLRKTVLITAKSFSQGSIFVNSPFNPVLDAHKGLLSAEGNSSSARGRIDPSPGSFDEDIEFHLFLNIYQKNVFGLLLRQLISLQPLFERIPEVHEEDRSSLRGVPGQMLTHKKYQCEFIPEIKMGYLNGWSRYGRGKYLVLLLKDSSHTDKIVSMAIPAIFPQLTTWDAKILLQKSRQQGYAVVIVAAKLESAVSYVQKMKDYGLRADLVPT